MYSSMRRRCTVRIVSRRFPFAASHRSHHRATVGVGRGRVHAVADLAPNLLRLVASHDRVADARPARVLVAHQGQQRDDLLEPSSRRGRGHAGVALVPIHANDAR